MDEVSDTSLEEGLLEQMRREDDIKNELSEHSLYIKTPIEDPHSRATEGYAGDVDTSVWLMPYLIRPVTSAMTDCWETTKTSRHQ